MHKTTDGNVILPDFGLEPFLACLPKKFFVPKWNPKELLIVRREASG